MTQPWLDAFPRTVKPLLDEIDEILGFKLSTIIAEGTNAQLNATENSQPAIMATSILILRVLEKEFGLNFADRVDFTLGHSLGEFAALVAAGYMDFADSLQLVRKRGQAMADCTKEAIKKSGGEVGMVAMMCETEEHLRSLVAAIEDFTGMGNAGAKHDSAESRPPVEQVVIANMNSKNQIVLSGSIERIKILMSHLRQFGGHDPRHVRLNSDSPFHSPLMRPAQRFMKKALGSPSPRSGNDMVNWPGIVPCISNVTGRPFESREKLKDELARQTTETVRWWDSVRYLDQEAHVRRWIGIGPGKVGRNLVGKEVGMKGSVKGGGVWGITSPAEAEEVMKALDDTEYASDH